ncbi:MAG TPA: penicillin acylase family protein [Candidatus Baltobacteraceae bacterium]|nr:penicillin acylase family protein [Candidatus Baltobacteraceae bacterium]
MSVIPRQDPRLLACKDPPWPSALLRTLRRHASIAGILMVLAVCCYFANVLIGFRVAAQDGGIIAGMPTGYDVTIARDARGIAHIRAHDVHDLFVAQGFAEASDRLFEMDLTRRYAYGRLAEVFGAKALMLDEQMRAADIREIAARQWQGSDAATRRALKAFSQGVNAAERRQPLPVEFRMLLYRPGKWTPQDSIAVAIVAALELGDSWYDVLARDDRWKALGARCYSILFPLSDARYDVSLGGRAMHDGTRAGIPAACADHPLAFNPARTRLGSNAWAAGSQLTAHHRALIANDPHVDLTIPGIWYVMDLRAPGLHAAGAVIPGLPGIALGHNEHLAWAVTNAQVATSVIYRAPKIARRYCVMERFDVRFAPAISKAYYRTKDAFSIEAGEDNEKFLVRWPPFAQRRTSISTLIALDRAPTISAAMHALSSYTGAPQNFILADTSGSVAYHLAGAIPDDPAWGRYVHPARDFSKPVRLIPFTALPARAASRGGVLLTANNRIYGSGYRYRLSAAFEPPYRAYRIAALLHERRRYDAAYFERMQLDACSPIDAEIAKDLTRVTQRSETLRDTTYRASLARWNGCFTRASRTASLEHADRDMLLQQNASLAALLARLRHPGFDSRNGIEEAADAVLFSPGAPHPWGQTGEVDVEHPLSPAWYGLLRGVPLPGDGDEYTIHLQEPGFAQGFRAVWDVGNWDAGGIVLPSGESGEPASGHYDDLARTWISGEMVPLPFTPDAVARQTTKALTLAP